MSTKTYDTALDFMPARVTRGKGFRANVRSFFAALVEGLEAQNRYERNVARGLTPANAAAKAFDDTYAAR